jgi:hypothetical protein
MVGAGGDSRLDTRLQAVSAGLRAVRVVSAARRCRAGLALTDTDISTIRSVVSDLREEIRVLRNENIPDVTDETAFAFASLALSALPTQAENQGNSGMAARQLESLVSDIEALISSDSSELASLKRIEDVFLKASDLVGSEVGGTGEKVDGQMERML